MALIEIASVSKDYPSGEGVVRALAGIDLSIERGEFTGFIGPSGSGKTTLLNIIGCLDKPTTGDVQLMDQSFADMSDKVGAEVRRKHLGFIFQTFNLLPVYTVYENVEFPLQLLRMPESERRRRVLDALDRVGLSDKRNSRPSQLSGGQAQRVAIARAIVKDPKVVLADEPTANLDAKNATSVIETMLRLNEESSMTFIFATHDEKVIRYLRRRIYLDDGKITNDEAAESPAVNGSYPGYKSPDLAQALTH